MDGISFTQHLIDQVVSFFRLDRGEHLESGLVDDLLVRRWFLQAHDDRNWNELMLLGIDDPWLRGGRNLRYHRRCPPEWPSRWCLFQDDPEGLFHLGRVGGAAYVEVGRIATRQFDHVHGRHGQAGAVHRTTDVTVELHIVEAVLVPLPLRWDLLSRNVAELFVVRMTEQAVLVEIHRASTAMILSSLVLRTG